MAINFQLLIGKDFEPVCSFQRSSWCFQVLSTMLRWSLARFWSSLALFIYVLINEDVLGGVFHSFLWMHLDFYNKMHPIN